MSTNTSNHQASHVGKVPYCNNCGKDGHMYHQCKVPITSIGIIAFRISPDGTPQYLMIRRKDTLGHIDFMRGKYSVCNKSYIMNMLNQMTVQEKERMKLGDFSYLWKEIWGGNPISNQYKMEEAIAREKYDYLMKGIVKSDDFYTLTDLISESNDRSSWTEAEWGFPKGRRNHQEKDFECALREFEEETGYSRYSLKNIKNIIPYEEIFTGSNYKSYKHKYYLMMMDYENSIITTDQHEPTEVSKMEWKTCAECVDCIRNYNVEKIRLVECVHRAVTECFLYQT